MKTTNEIRKDFFNQRAEQWMDTFYKDPASGAYSRYSKEFERLFKAIALKKGDRVLDVGCGSGVLVPFILEKIGANGILYELDYAPEMIRENKKRHRDNRIQFLVQDLLDFEAPENSFDAVICFACFPHFEDKSRAMTIISGLVKNKGTLAIAHMDSSRNINDHHRKSPEVMHDYIPDKQTMYSLCEQNKLSINRFIDEEGFYLLLAKRE
jgi:ubiquinone/menaquinone biosynthesis C-methylase UbiE